MKVLASSSGLGTHHTSINGNLDDIVHVLVLLAILVTGEHDVLLVLLAILVTGEPANKLDLAPSLVLFLL